MPATSTAAHQGGKIIADAFYSVKLEMRLLNALFDADRALSVAELEAQLRCTRRDLWTAIRVQARLGNIKNVQPIELTAAARIAIGAGRAADPPALTA